MFYPLCFQGKNNSIKMIFSLLQSMWIQLIPFLGYMHLTGVSANKHKCYIAIWAYTFIYTRLSIWWIFAVYYTCKPSKTHFRTQSQSHSPFIIGKHNFLRLAIRSAGLFFHWHYWKSIDGDLSFGTGWIDELYFSLW